MKVLANSMAVALRLTRLSRIDSRSAPVGDRAILLSSMLFRTDRRRELTQERALLLDNRL